jgi:LacI family transcriptional regulator
MNPLYNGKTIMRRSTTTTLDDVAREAGVSAMTASVVLNGSNSSARVSAGTRARVLEVAARLHYRRNALALGLSRSRIDTLGVVSSIRGGELNLYFLEVLNGILEAAAERGQTTKVFSMIDWHTEEARLLQFCDGRIDGLILIGPILTPEFITTLQHAIPFVSIHSNQTMPRTYNLDVDNEEGAYAIVRYLIDKGHRRIAHFPGSNTGAQQRLKGYRRALEDSGIPYDERLVVPGSYSIWSGRHRMEIWLQERTYLPTAIFCASDAIAFGCMEVLAERSIQVPEDISIVGFDDTLMARTTIPRLTTMRQPFFQMGRRAVELLLMQINEESVPQNTRSEAQQVITAPEG